MIQGIILDMDGVLIDSHSVHRHAWGKFLVTVGKTVSDHELDFILEGRRREEILRHFLGELPVTTIAEYGRLKDKFFEENFGRIKLIPGVRRFLDVLETLNLKTGIATSASSSRTFGTLHRLKLEKKFTTVVTGDDVLAGKPDPAVYRLASERMNILPHKLLALEDAPCGVEAAKAAGMRCVGVTRNGRADALREAGAECVIPDFVGLSADKLHQLWNSTDAGTPHLLGRCVGTEPRTH